MAANTYCGVESPWNQPSTSYSNPVIHPSNGYVFDNEDCQDAAYVIVNHAGEDGSFICSPQDVQVHLDSQQMVNVPDVALEADVIYEEITTAHCVDCDRLVDIRKEHHTVDQCLLEKELSCLECGERFNYEQNFQVHAIVHHFKPDQFVAGKECDLCDSKLKRKSFQRFHSFVAHMKTHFKPDYYICNKCPLEFDFMAMLKRHRRVEHGQAVEKSNIAYSTELGYCPKCNKLIEQTKVASHRMTHSLHRKIDVKKEKKAQLESKLQPLAEEPKYKKPHKCTHCEKAFRRPAELRRHVVIHEVQDKGPKWTCSVCQKKFVHHASLLSHTKNVHATDAYSHECKICGLTFAKASNVERHIKIVHPIEVKKATFDCTECSCQFNGQNALKRHVNSHHDTDGEGFIYRCNICRKVFPRKWSLLRHSQVHNTLHERPHKCNRCEKRYKLRSSLKLHMDVHARKDVDDPVLTDPKCPICLKHISSLNNLRKHMMTHCTNYECPDCSQHFATMHRLDRHKCPMTTEEPSGGGDGVELATLADSSSGPTQPSLSQLPVAPKKSYFCKVCPASFYSFKVYKDHTSLHSGSKPHGCWTCHKSFRTKELLESHKIIHSSDPVYCEFCPLTIYGRAQYRQHVRTVHQQNAHTQSVDQAVVRCNESERAIGISSSQSYPEADLTGRELAEGLFQTRAASADPEGRDPMESHVIWMEGDTIETAADRAIRCCVCHHLYDSIGHLAQHWNNVSMEMQHSFAVIQCPLCAQSLQGSSVAAAHVTSVHPYMEETDPARKQFLHGGPVLTYPTCSNGDVLYDTETVDRSHVCSQCCSAFLKKSDLERHFRVHTDERPYQCTVCSRAFRVRSALNAHIKIHDRGPPQELCTVCTKQFYTKTALTLHLRIHSGEKPLKCHHCSMSFRTSAARINHEATVHDLSTRHSCTRKGCKMCIAARSRRMRMANSQLEAPELSQVLAPGVSEQDMPKGTPKMIRATMDSNNSYGGFGVSSGGYLRAPEIDKPYVLPVKRLVSVPIISQDPTHSVRETMAEISRVAAMPIHTTQGSAFTTHIQPSATVHTPSQIHITARRISITEYSVSVAYAPPKEIRHGIDTTSSIGYDALLTLSSQNATVRLPLMDNQQLNVLASGVLNALGGEKQVLLRARPVDPLNRSCVELLPPSSFHISSDFITRCDICDVALPTKAISDAHMASEDHETAQVMNPLAEAGNDSMENLMIPIPHIRTKAVIDFTCKLCGGKYDNMEHLVAHIRRDHERDHPHTFQPRQAARTAPPLERDRIDD